MTMNSKPDDDKDLDTVEAMAKGLSKALNMPVFYINKDIPEKLAEIVIQENPDILKELSKGDVYSEISDVFSHVVVVEGRGKPQDEVIELAAEKITELIEVFKKGQEVTAYVFIPSIRDLPLNIKLGNAEIIDRKSIKLDRADGFDAHLDHYKKYYKGTNFDDDGAWVKFTFKSKLNRNIRNDFYKNFQPILGTLSLLLYGHKLSEQKLVGVIVHGHQLSFIGPETIGRDHLTSGWAKYSDHLASDIAILSKILSAQKPTEIEKKIITSSKLYNLGAETSSSEAIFISVISALEGLLSTKYDRDFLGHKLAEKSAFILEDEKSGRIKIFKEIKRLYDLRSTIVHGSSKSSKFTEQDLSTIDQLYRNLFKKMLILSGTIKTAEDFDEYINERRFS